MTTTTTYDVTTGRPSAEGFFARARKSVADYRRYRATLTELETLNDRELLDLGISRFSLREVAYESVYGA